MYGRAYKILKNMHKICLKKIGCLGGRMEMPCPGRIC
jgi:hypothetical protein